jgi:hypothetical protein
VAEAFRHDLVFRVLHWVLVAEGVLLVLTGFQLGGAFLGVVIFTSDNLLVHETIGIAFIGSAILFAGNMARTGDIRWVSLRRIPHSIRFVGWETKGWFGLAPAPVNPILYDGSNKRYIEKFVP